MSVAIVFPGQGTQFVNMGNDFYNQDLVYKHYYDLFASKYPSVADAVNGSGDLNLTENAQLALFANQASIFKSIDHRFNLDGVIYAGFSLGEYNAYLASGLFDFETGLKIIQMRSMLMSKVMSTYVTKVAIGLTYEEISNVVGELNEQLEKPILISNHNNETQVLLNFEEHLEQSIAMMLKEKGVKRLLPIAISGPFHTPLYTESSLEFGKYLNDIELNKVTSDLFLNVTGDKYDGTNIKSIMQDHLVCGVKWYEQVKQMIEMGVSTFVEVGSKSVLASMIKKIDRNVKVVTVERIEDIEKLELIWNRK